jgi:hypothetical protein
VLLSINGRTSSSAATISVSFLKISPRPNIAAIFTSIMSWIFGRISGPILLAVLSALFFFIIGNQDLQALPQCSTIKYPNYARYFTNCTFPGCKSADTQIDTSTTDGDAASNCQTPNCPVPLGSSDIPNVTCLLPNCPTINTITQPSSSCILPGCNTPIAETNCSLPICPETLGTNDIPMQTCSFPPCGRPLLAATDQPGINCSVPLCSKPLKSTDVPRVNCSLPRCPYGGNVADVDCTYPACSTPLASGEVPEVNCSLRLCFQPLGKSDKPGENCTLRKCRNRTVGCSGDECTAISNETPGLDCAMPNCSDPSIAIAQPGINCLYEAPKLVLCSSLAAADRKPNENCVNRINRIVPVCDGTETLRNHGVNCMDMSDLPTCTNASGQIHGKNCINTCSGNSSDKPGITCTLPSCDSLGNKPDGSPIKPLPGQNCLYSINGKVLPLCKNNINLSTKKHRINCADIIDLPLCTEMGKSGQPSAKDGANCVVQCDTIPTPTSLLNPIRGTNFAIHNSDCIQFCPATVITDSSTTPPTSVQSNDESKCTPRLCHQMQPQFSGDGIDQNPPESSSSSPNCTPIACDLLTPEEMNSSKFSKNEQYLYCVGSNTKCYDFKASQLPFMISRQTNTMCAINSCKPDPATCSLFDDTSNIAKQGKDFTNAYLAQFYGNSPINNQMTCAPQLCLPIINRAYRCSPETDPAASIRNPSCDSSGNGAQCINAYCYKTIDCNSSINSTEAECIVETDSQGSVSLGTIDDVTNGWFFRPKPPNKSYKDLTNMIFRDMDRQRICYSRGNMENQPETKDVILPFKYDGTNRNWGAKVSMGFEILGIRFAIPLGYFHSGLLPDETRSPGMCEGSGNNLATKNNNRGSTVEYVCGNKGAFWNRVSQETAYFAGYVKTTFQDRDAAHQVKICLRFKNVWRPDDLAGSGETCGARECAVSCGFGLCLSQTCGQDVCRILTINDTNPQACIARADIMDETNILKSAGSSRECLSRIGSQLRLRAVKYGRHICAYVDAKGPPAYNNIFLNGTEKVFAGTPFERCISGNSNPDSQGVCHGYNTNDLEGSNFMWRTLIKVPYIMNNRPATEAVRGYLDFDGRLFKEQECIKVPLRISPPNTYNLANIKNSFKIFSPPLYIVNSRLRKNGPISIGVGANKLGPTDFHYPEIDVNFGKTIKKLSLDIGQTGYEDQPPASSIATIDSGTNPNFQVEVIAKKEFSNSNEPPRFCLYRRVRDSNGAYISPARVQCVERQLPEINGLVKTADNLSFDSRRFFTFATGGNTFNSAKISFRFLSGSPSAYDSALSSCAASRAQCVSACNSDAYCINDCYSAERLCINNCNNSSTSCSNAVSLDNSNPDYPTCSTDIERHKICVQREPCSRLNYECMQNELDLNNAKLSGAATADFEAIRKNCTDNIAVTCNKKFGIDPLQKLSMFDSANMTSPYAYGWYNEICVVSGFSTKIRNVISKVLSSAMGKCVIDPTSPNMQSGGPGCSGGGLAPGCKCLEYVEGQELAEDETVRKETPHEAGLCIEIPRPKTCSAISYNKFPNSDTSDSNYIRFSMSKENCNTTGSLTGSCATSAPKYCGDSGYDPTYCIHQSHKYRTNSTNPDNLNSAFSLGGHAEFPSVIAGMMSVDGNCKGFWKNKPGFNGSTVAPKASCTSDANNNPVWTNLINDCVRYSCFPIIIDSNGLSDSDTYTSGFITGGETGDKMGEWNGFAQWPRFDKTNDFPEKVTATSCIIGFRNNGSALDIDTNKYNYFVAANPILKSTLDTETSTTSKPFHALFRLIKGTKNGTPPQRFCNQVGSFTPVDKNSECVRIQCPALSPPIPSSSSDSTAWALWQSTGGAYFPAANASRSATRIEAGSTVTAQQRQYTKADGTTFMSYCNESLGFSQMPGAPPPSIDCDHLGNWSPVKNKCVSGCQAVSTNVLANTVDNGFAFWDAASVTTPGQPADGTFKGCAAGYYTNPYPPATDKFGNSLAADIANDLTRAPSTPLRICGPSSSGNTVWGVVVAPCVNSCPDSITDPRIGAGKTKHYLYNSAGNSLADQIVSWPNTPLGQWAEITSPSAQDASNYILTGSYRANNFYAIRRYCNPTTHKWDEPLASCSTNGGVVNNAIIGTAGNNILVASGSSISATSCSAGYVSSVATQPLFQCQQVPLPTNVSNIGSYGIITGTNFCMVDQNVSSGQYKVTYSENGSTTTLTLNSVGSGGALTPLKSCNITKPSGTTDTVYSTSYSSTSQTIYLPYDYTADGGTSIDNVWMANMSEDNNTLQLKMVSYNYYYSKPGVINFTGSKDNVNLSIAKPSNFASLRADSPLGITYSQKSFNDTGSQNTSSTVYTFQVSYTTPKAILIANYGHPPTSAVNQTYLSPATSGNITINLNKTFSKSADVGAANSSNYAIQQGSGYNSENNSTLNPDVIFSYSGGQMDKTLSISKPSNLSTLRYNTLSVSNETSTDFTVLATYNTTGTSTCIRSCTFNNGQVLEKGYVYNGQNTTIPAGSSVSIGCPLGKYPAESCGSPISEVSAICNNDGTISLSSSNAPSCQKCKCETISLGYRTGMYGNCGNYSSDSIVLTLKQGEQLIGHFSRATGGGFWHNGVWFRDCFTAKVDVSCDISGNYSKTTSSSDTVYTKTSELCVDYNYGGPQDTACLYAVNSPNRFLKSVKNTTPPVYSGSESLLMRTGYSPMSIPPGYIFYNGCAGGAASAESTLVCGNLGSITDVKN